MTDPTDRLKKAEGHGTMVDLEPGSIQVLEGSTFMLSDQRGDVREGTVGGLYHEDTRHLSRWSLTIAGVEPVVLTSDEVDYYSAAFFMTNPDLEGIPARSLTIQRHRFVGDGVRETIRVRNHLREPVEVELRLACAADFADLFEVKGKEFRKGGVTTRAHNPSRPLLSFGYEHEVFRAATKILSTQPARIDGDDLVWDLRIDARDEWHTGVVVAVHVDEEVLEPTHQTFGDPEKEATRVLGKWEHEVPVVESGSDVLRHVYDKSVVDLAALRLRAEVEGNEYSLPAAGLPWFMTIFGRDTLITAYQSIWVGPELARGALLALAAYQGTDSNDFKDEEPGKILHEIRFGELSLIGLKPHRPYYGSADATPLWLIVLSEYWRWTGDDETVRTLEPNARRALEWLERFGDLDGDGYVEYRTRSTQGLRTQGWKDSWNGIQFADGRLPEPPIALSEIQGYAYDARLRAAELADRVWGDPQLAERLRAGAAALFDRFNDDFWIDARGGYYAIGLDDEKRQIDSLTSNLGHLLWSGIVPPERAGAVRDRLMSPELFSGWGVRTLSSEDAGYNPIGYHLGTVWPHDNSLISAGLARYGFRDEANRIALALLEASKHSEHRLPEVFAGYSRDESPFPVRYPTACSPQAWATAAPFLWLRVFLGMEPREGGLALDPAVPEEVGDLRVRGIHAHGGHHDAEG
ncbi:MAG TPA: glycogen debranching N-terminal domain-containing protein [Actinomycetota bacterium]